MICNKIKHKHFEHALKHIRSFKDSVSRNCYYCPSCNSWHITQKQNKKYINGIT